jgi:AraC-like DNA-binding protein
MRMKKLPPPFQVRTAGLVDRWTFHSTPGTRQGDIMLTVFLAGRGVYRNSQGSIEVTGGMAGLVPPEDAGILMADAGDPYAHYYCRFSGGYAIAMARSVLKARGARFFGVSNADALAACLSPIGRFHRKDLPERMGLPEALLAQALVLLQDEPRLTGRWEELSATSLRYYLRDRVSAPTKLSEIAGHFGVSVSTLCRKAQALCGQSVQQLHEAAKIEWAKVLLSTGTLNVSEVALRVGYADPFYFSRVFKLRVGSPPKGWSMKKLRPIRREKPVATDGD